MLGKKNWPEVIEIPFLHKYKKYFSLKLLKIIFFKAQAIEMCPL
jgi:hypothetical protein